MIFLGGTSSKRHPVCYYNVIVVITMHRHAAADVVNFCQTFKWPEDPLNLVKIKNPFGCLQTNPLENAWWVGLFYFAKKTFLVHPTEHLVCLFVCLFV